MLMLTSDFRNSDKISGYLKQSGIFPNSVFNLFFSLIESGRYIWVFLTLAKFIHKALNHYQKQKLSLY